MKNMRLSEAERQGVRIGWTDGKKVGMVEAKALGKLLSERPAYADGLAQSLGRVWCPMKGIQCKSVGDNIFMFTFLQPSGKRKALDEGLWMVNNDLVIIEEFDPEKTVEDYQFASVPIWVHVLKLPLGLMNRDTAVKIAAQMGLFMEADVDEEGNAKGKYLRFKVRIDVAKPLMRGTTTQVGETGKTHWCPFEYEYLPEFCFTCGILGHDDKMCTTELAKGEQQQYGKWLKAYMPKRQQDSDRQIWSDSRGSWRNNNLKGAVPQSRSDSLSWRKEDGGQQQKVSGGSSMGRPQSSEEVTSPAKEPRPKEIRTVHKSLSFAVATDGEGALNPKIKNNVTGPGSSSVGGVAQHGGKTDGQPNLHGADRTEDCSSRRTHGVTNAVPTLKEGEKTMVPYEAKKFKRLKGTRAAGTEDGKMVLDKKRQLEQDMSGVLEEKKKQKVDTIMEEADKQNESVKAGLSEQLRSTQ